MATELDLHFAAPPPDSAEPGDGVRYLLDQAAFLADQPERINFRGRVRMLLRQGRAGEALLAALAYDDKTLRLRGLDAAQAITPPPQRKPDAPPPDDGPAKPDEVVVQTWR